jgi:hypothetical protein
MKSSAFLCLLFILWSQIILAQVDSNFFPEGNARANIKSMKGDIKAKNKCEMPAFDVQAMMREDEGTSNAKKPKPFRFGKGIDTNIKVRLLSRRSQVRILSRSPIFTGLPDFRRSFSFVTLICYWSEFCKFKPSNDTNHEN